MADTLQPAAQQHIISLLVNNRPGVLIRIALVFSRRGYNLESLVVSPAENPSFSHMSLVATGDRKTLDQIIKQINKLVDVIHAIDHTGETMVERELALIKVRCPAGSHAGLQQMAGNLKAHPVDTTGQTMIFEVTGSSEEISSMQALLSRHGTVETVRSGKLFMARGEGTT